ncbi:CBS domain-containing protein [Limobrevibacterium gyesilva]|uniref:CBS domain-containing protein n=1 Tax=Limobrevibacterium gyesilva TaxID=2991712 RepID=A0AA41YXN4_9PROT|nr:CBS domain-containing protein [Limobrevibacterium gyesilva]MCW3477207.1 CBS domain-containing protein [Limobrevibacterium gyesilva]
MKAADIMTRDVVTVTPDTPVPEIARLMLGKRISAVPVVEGGVPVGIVSEGDLLRRAETGTEPHTPRWLELFLSRDSLAAEYVRTHGRAARDVMSAPVVTVEETAPIAEIAELMDWRRIKRVPVLGQDGRMVGIISRANLLQGLASRAAQPACTADDMRIRDALLAELRSQGWAGVPDEGNVIVEDGVVHLWGIVRQPNVRRAMVVAAQAIPGVKAVEDHLDRRRDADALTWPNWPQPAPP